MRPIYGRSPWIDRFPKSRVPSLPKLKGQHETEVVVIGGGLTGCATAYALAAAGIRVMLLEADRIGRGASAASSGWITDVPATSFAQLDELAGRRAARHAFQAWRRAALDFQALLRRLDVKCHLEPRETITLARTPDDAMVIAREHKVRTAAKVEGQLLSARALTPIAGFTATSGLRTKDSATVDPYRAVLGLASAAAARGAAIFERTPVTKTGFSREGATVVAGGASITASRVIVATGQPGTLFKPLARHLSPHAAYLVLTEPVPAKLRKALGSRDHLLRDTADPPHRISWVDDERFLVSGADSDPIPARLRDATLVQRTGQLMYELSTFYPDISGLQPAYGWDAPYAVSATGLPLIGPHRNYPHHLFAFGDASQGLTGAYLASRILLRHYLDETQSADDVFGFAR